MPNCEACTRKNEANIPKIKSAVPRNVPKFESAIRLQQRTPDASR